MLIPELIRKKRDGGEYTAEEIQELVGGITDGSVGGGIRRLFMSHPPLDERIAALRALPAEGNPIR